jgi:hypothetical protein
MAAIGAVLGAIVGAPWVNPLWGFVLGGVAGFVVGLVAAGVVAVWPVLRVLWHWAAEITATLLVVSVGTVLSSRFTPVVPLLLCGGVAVVIVAMPGLRCWVRSWAWCAIVRHRLRLSFAAFIRSHNRLHGRGAAPLILLARPTPAGERVWVWLRAGLDLAELEANVAKLAVACWAADVRVTGTSERHAALVHVDVTRCDPLKATVDAPFAAGVPDSATAAEPPAVELIGGLNLSDVSAEDADVAALPRLRGGGR